MEELINMFFPEEIQEKPHLTKKLNCRLKKRYDENIFAETYLFVLSCIIVVI